MNRLDDPGIIGRVFIDGKEHVPGEPVENWAAVAPTHERDERGLLQPAILYSESDIAALEADLHGGRELVVPEPEGDDLVPMAEDQDGQVTVEGDASESVTLRSTQLEPDEGEEEEEGSAAGPLPAIPDHDWTQEEQTAALALGDAIYDRAIALNVSEEVAAQLTHDLMREDYVGIIQHRLAKDREDMAAARAELSDRFGEDFPEALRNLERHLASLPDGIGRIIAEARDPRTGQRLLNNVSLAEWLFYVSALAADDADAAQISPESQNELAELEELMNTSIDEFRTGRWKNTGMTPSERMYQLNRRLADARIA